MLFIMQCIDFNDNIVTEIGASSLSMVLEKLEFLQELDLGDCLLRNKGGLHISNALKSLKSPIKVLKTLIEMILEVKYWI